MFSLIWSSCPYRPRFQFVFCLNGGSGKYKLEFILPTTKEYKQRDIIWAVSWTISRQFHVQIQVKSRGPILYVLWPVRLCCVYQSGMSIQVLLEPRTVSHVCTTDWPKILRSKTWGCLGKAKHWKKINFF